MIKNVGSRDKLIRYILAVICAYLAVTISWVFWIFTVALILTGAFGMCGVYKLLGINTNKEK